MNLSTQEICQRSCHLSLIRGSRTKRRSLCPLPTSTTPSMLQMSGIGRSCATMFHGFDSSKPKNYDSRHGFSATRTPIYISQVKPHVPCGNHARAPSMSPKYRLIAFWGSQHESLEPGYFVEHCQPDFEWIDVHGRECLGRMVAAFWLR